jgi:hypothetical protein
VVISEAVTDVARAACCRHPVRLLGSALDRATGELSERRVLVACKDRREAVCPACAAVYQGDAFQLVASGLYGGKGVPVEVVEHPVCFLTLTAPSFGAVHRGSERPGRSRPCRPRRDLGHCPHGEALACFERHRASDARLGQPLCDLCFDYEGAVLWNLGASLLWQRASVALRREVAALGSVPVRKINESFRLAYLKVAEFQRRGLVHLHVVVRADGSEGPKSAPPDWLDESVLERAAAAVPSRASAPRPGGGDPLRWGREFEVHVLGAGEEREAVAAYVAKYAVKTSGADPLLARRLDLAALPALYDSDPHLGALAATAWRLGSRPELARLHLRDHAHTFGYRGHFATKSLAYSTTFGALRAARAEHRGANETEDDHPGPEIDGWRYAGRGYDSAEASRLAEALAEGIRTRPRPSPATSPEVPRALHQGR